MGFKHHSKEDSKVKILFHDSDQINVETPPVNSIKRDLGTSTDDKVETIPPYRKVISPALSVPEILSAVKMGIDKRRSKTKAHSNQQVQDVTKEDETVSTKKIKRNQ